MIPKMNIVFSDNAQGWAFDKFVADRFGDSRLSDEELQSAYREFLRLPLLDCRRCGELLADEDGEQLCSDCRACERCGCRDRPLKRYVDFWGWLCDECAGTKA